MKFTMLALLVVLAVGTAFAQDTTATPSGNFYADSLKSTAYPAGNGSARDTVDVVVSSMFDVDYYNVTAWSSSADTLQVSALTADGSRFVIHGVVCLSDSGFNTTLRMVTGTTAQDFIVAGGPEQKKLRFTSPGTTNAIYFIVTGKRGVPIY
jgi:hypothetical protein